VSIVVLRCDEYSLSESSRAQDGLERVFELALAGVHAHQHDEDVLGHLVVGLHVALQCRVVAEHRLLARLERLAALHLPLEAADDDDSDNDYNDESNDDNDNNGDNDNDNNGDKDDDNEDNDYNDNNDDDTTTTTTTTTTMTTTTTTTTTTTMTTMTTTMTTTTTTTTTTTMTTTTIFRTGHFRPRIVQKIQKGHVVERLDGWDEARGVAGGCGRGAGPARHVGAPPPASLLPLAAGPTRSWPPAPGSSRRRRAGAPRPCRG